MGLFGFFNKSKFSKMSAQEKAREQGYAYLLCIEYAAESNKTEKGNDKVSDEDLKILSIASEAINIGSEYLNCELRKSKFFDDSEDGNHFKEVLSSLDLKTKRLAIKQMLIVYSNREKLENLLDENGNYILKGKYITPIEKIAYLMGINEEVEDLVKDMIYEINKLELNDSELSNSENDLTKVILKSDEEDALKHLVIGISKYGTENYEEAIEDYKKSIELNPYNARTYLEIGNARLKLNDYKGAILDYSKSIELDSNHADTYHNRSIAKSKLADYQGVIDDCTKTIEIDNNYTSAYFNRGTAYANLQEFMEAIVDMNSVIKLDPNNSNAFKNRGICMYEFEQYDSALKDLNKAMELDPNSNAYITIDKIKEELLNIEVENEFDLIINQINTELSELSDKTKGELYDYSYWFDVVCNRAKSHSFYDELNNENIIQLSDGHCEEYHYRMIENDDNEKAEFITPRIISFAMIYEKLLSINHSKLSSDDISKLDILKFHSIASLYGSIKFALEDITEGKKLVNVIYPNYVEELTSKKNNNKTEDESEVSIRLFSPQIRFLLNELITNKIHESIPKKNTSEFANLIKLVNQMLPIDNSNEFDKNIPIYDSIKNEISKFNNEQTLLIQRLFSVLIIYSKEFLYIDLLIFILELIIEIELEISEDSKNDISDIEIVFGTVNRLKAKFGIFNFVETLRSRLYSGIIQNEQELLKIIENEFSLDIFLEEDEKIKKATEGLEIQLKRALEMIGAAKMIRFDVDYLATILNEYDDDRFYGFDYIENYHTIYSSIYNCLIESSGKELKME